MLRQQHVAVRLIAAALQRWNCQAVHKIERLIFGCCTRIRTPRCASRAPLWGRAYALEGMQACIIMGTTVGECYGLNWHQYCALESSWNNETM